MYVSHVSTYLHAHTHVHMNTYTHIRMHIYTLIYTRLLGQPYQSTVSYKWKRIKNSFQYTLELVKQCHFVAIFILRLRIPVWYKLRLKNNSDSESKSESEYDLSSDSDSDSDSVSDSDYVSLRRLRDRNHVLFAAMFYCISLLWPYYSWACRR